MVHKLIDLDTSVNYWTLKVNWKCFEVMFQQISIVNCFFFCLCMFYICRISFPFSISIFELTVKMNIVMEWSDDLISDIDKTSENKLC